ncbi:MAG: ATP-binding cassette domain-containing protein [Pseudomonadota bacterium]
MTDFFDFVRAVVREAPLTLPIVAALLVVGAVAQVTLIVLFARHAGAPLEPSLLIEHVWLVAGLLIIAVTLTGLSTALSIQVGREVGTAASLDLVDRIAGARFDAVNAIGPARLRTALTVDVEAAASAGGTLGLFWHAVVTAVLVFAVVLALAPAVGSIMLIVLLAVSVAERTMMVMAKDAIHEALAADDRVADRIGALHAAGADFRLNRARAADYRNSALRPAILAAGRLRLIAGAVFIRRLVLFRVTFMVIGAASQPFLFATHDVVTAMFASLGLIFCFVSLNYAIIAADTIQFGIDARLRIDALSKILGSQTQADGAPAHNAKTLTFEEARYAYPDGAFAIGPLNIGFDRPETTVVFGNNGSGKTTMLRVLSGLLEADAGRVMADGRPRLASERQTLFATVFSDYHLFHKTHGATEGERAALTAWIERLGLRQDVQLLGDTFSTRALSSGQRKRLALGVALAENRPILLLDEWTADQSPGFRRWFYETLLPELKADGRLVIAVSHDDQYRAHADRVIEMAGGIVKHPDEPLP